MVLKFPVVPSPKQVFLNIPLCHYSSISGPKYYPWSLITVPVSGPLHQRSIILPMSLLPQSVVHSTTQGLYSLDQRSTVLTMDPNPFTSGTTFKTSSPTDQFFLYLVLLVILSSLSHWSLLLLRVPTPCASGP